MDVEPFSMSEPTTRLGRIGILWRGDEAARRSATPETSRFKAVFARATRATYRHRRTFRQIWRLC